jgi:hypothetical protein
VGPAPSSPRLTGNEVRTGAFAAEELTVNDGGETGNASDAPLLTLKRKLSGALMALTAGAGATSGTASDRGKPPPMRYMHRHHDSDDDDGGEKQGLIGATS